MARDLYTSSSSWITSAIKALRVVDASVIPRLISANTNAAAIMIGERGADFALRDLR